MDLRYFFIIFLLMPLLSTFAQKIERVHGEYAYHVPDNISLEEGKRTALERAKIQALADAFGTLVSQSNSTIVKNEEGKSSVDFLSIGGSDVKGEWIETLGEPKFDIFYENNALIIKATIDGKAREIKNASIDFEAKLLRNGTDLKFESDEFRNGDDLYLYFKSSINGYLAVYLLDETTQQVFCLLPYKSSGEPAYTIGHDKPYVFFSCQKADRNPNAVDEYNMTCEHSLEQNTIYIVFSPNMFAKANTKNEDAGLPRQLPLKEFLRWLGKCKTKDTEAQIKSITIKIYKR
ncbi:DUF4384 domain-containing protein [Segatella copri]|jgi:hypothetical protein|uniref:DUF4384 domain-containing protein n=1 Tax=Segatella copri TaxID=165179 RepID=UPI002115A5F6|nr:DUF4384 domain-containing protein [Segatella copri]